MVVLSAAILSKSQTLLARQFVDFPKARIEGLFSAFTKLVDSERKDSTYLETDSVRYVFQHMENLYLVLVTSKQSNILEDMDTLKLIYKILQDLQVHDEKSVTDKAFDIVFAVDEVVSFGYRESVTASQVKTYTEMDSHEERLHRMIEKSKEQEAKETAKRKQMELAKAKAQMLREGRSEAAAEMPTFGSEDFDAPGSFPKRSEQPLAFRSAAAVVEPVAAWTPGMSDDVQVVTASAGKKGMSLGMRKKQQTVDE